MKKIILLFVLSISVSLLGAPKDTRLTATIIGSGSPIYNKERCGPSVLISAGDTKILVDMGNGTQGNLEELGIDIREFSALLFTHHHLDHNEEFVPIFIKSLLGRNAFEIIGPSYTKKLAEVNLELYEEDIEYRLGKTNRSLKNRKNSFTARDIEGGESFTIGDIEISTIEVPHTIHTIAYRFDYRGESVVVTGDLTSTPDLVELAKEADFMIIDSGGMIMENSRKSRKTSSRGHTNTKRDNKERAHLNLEDSSLIAGNANVKNLVYTHFTKGVIDKEASLEVIQKNYKGNVIFGEDLMELKN